MHVCVVRVLISNCWRYTGLSCFLSRDNPATQKPPCDPEVLGNLVWLGMFSVEGDVGAEAPVSLPASVTSSLWHNRNANTHTRWVDWNAAVTWTHTFLWNNWIASIATGLILQWKQRSGNRRKCISETQNYDHCFYKMREAFQHDPHIDLV